MRIGSRVKNTHRVPQTPYARVLACSEVSGEEKAQLREAYATLSMVDLRLQINQLQDQLLDSVSGL
jgi:hypothetical protein